MGIKWIDWERRFWPVFSLFLALGLVLSGLRFGPIGALFSFMGAVFLVAELKCISLLVSVITKQNKMNSFYLTFLYVGKVLLWIVIAGAPFWIPSGFGYPFIIGCALYFGAFLVTTTLALKLDTKV